MLVIEVSESSSIQAISYDEPSRDLYVTFRRPPLGYVFHGVDKRVLPILPMPGPKASSSIPIYGLSISMTNHNPNPISLNPIFPLPESLQEQLRTMLVADTVPR